jgi:hypothetical protein
VAHPRPCCLPPTIVAEEYATPGSRIGRRVSPALCPPEGVLGASGASLTRVTGLHSPAFSSSTSNLSRRDLEQLGEANEHAV